jgi:hypothetical protein
MSDLLTLPEARRRKRIAYGNPILRNPVDHHEAALRVI